MWNTVLDYELEKKKISYNKKKFDCYIHKTEISNMAMKCGKYGRPS